MRVCSTTRVVIISSLAWVGASGKKVASLIIIQVTKFCVRSSGS